MKERNIGRASIARILEQPDIIECSFSNRKIAVKKTEKTWKVVFVQEQGRIVVISVYFV
ncbi:MAG: DUF4258 domain-containing protein [Candidatus ainarchaeum sp.]|nr:DUF4258 domain-containing protein [Candidatus ainarchaeum sp.]